MVGGSPDHFKASASMFCESRSAVEDGPGPAIPSEQASLSLDLDPHGLRSPFFLSRLHSHSLPYGLMGLSQSSVEELWFQEGGLAAR